VKPKGGRTIGLYFKVSPEEKLAIEKKMALLGTKNLRAYLRKMAVDGYIVNLDLSSINDLVYLLRRSSNNLNQIARRANETHSIYETDIEDLRQNYDRLWEVANRIMRELANI